MMLLAMGGAVGTYSNCRTILRVVRQSNVLP